MRPSAGTYVQVNNTTPPFHTHNTGVGAVEGYGTEVPRHVCKLSESRLTEELVPYSLRDLAQCPWKKKQKPTTAFFSFFAFLRNASIASYSFVFLTSLSTDLRVGRIVLCGCSLLRTRYCPCLGKNAVKFLFKLSCFVSELCQDPSTSDTFILFIKDNDSQVIHETRVCRLLGKN